MEREGKGTRRLMKFVGDRRSTRRDHRPAVLVVDDEECVRLSFELLLEDHYAVVAAADGRTAMDLIGSRSIDCVLLAVLLPGKDGFQVLQEIVALDPTLPVIMVTAVNALRPGVSAMKLGAYDYLSKPCDEGEVLAAIAGALDWRRRRWESTAVHGRGPIGGVPPEARARILVIDDQLGRRVTLGILLRPLGLVRASGVADASRRARWDPTLVVWNTAGRESAVLPALRDLRRHIDGWVLVIADAASGEPRAAFAGLERTDVLPAPGLLGEILQWVARRASMPSQPVRRLSRGIDLVLDHVRRQYAADCSVPTLAKAAQLSVRQCARAFREEVGWTLREFVSAVRAGVAQELRATTTHTSTRIAELAGFCNVSHMSRVVRRARARREGRRPRPGS